MINLIPEDIRDQIKYGRNNVIIVQYAVGLFLIAVVMAGLVFMGDFLIGRTENALEKQLATSTSEFESYSDTLAEAQELSNTIKTIETLLEREFKFSELLDKITALIPSGVTLDSISLSDEEDTLALTTTLEKQNLAGVFVKNMIESELFGRVDIESVGASDGSAFVAVFSVQFTPDETPVQAVPVEEPVVPAEEVTP